MTYLVALDVDPSTARPGWAAVVVVVLLAIALVFLYLSMRRQFRKINVGPSDERSASSMDASAPKPPDEMV
jgi:protein-S-isoprenylcysteine O-methyltransferase Ste14